MYAHELFEAGKPQVVVTYPGRFQPFHQGHAGVFAQLQKQFGRDSVYILTSNDQSSAKSPFNFTDKYQLMSAAGVPGDRIIETNQMYKLPEGFDPASTVFITAVGAPDKDRLNPDTFTKRDQKDKEGNVTKPAGSASYYKTWDPKNAPMTADQHGYVIVIPEIHKEIEIQGKKYDVSHGTECRNLWNQVRNNPESAKEFLMGLYGRATPELAAIFNKIPTAVSEDIGQVDSNYSSSPISGARVFHEFDPSGYSERYTLFMDGQQVETFADQDDAVAYAQESMRDDHRMRRSTWTVKDTNGEVVWSQDPGDEYDLARRWEKFKFLPKDDNLKESYEYRAPGAPAGLTGRILNKMKTPNKMIWKKPNQIGGSYTDQDLTTKGFKKSKYNSWGGTDSMWNSLSGLEEVAMNPKAFAQSIAQGQGKGVLVGFEFEVLMPAATVNQITPAAGAVTYNPNDESWIEGKTVTDFLTRLQPPVVSVGSTQNWERILDDLFKNKNSVASQLGDASIWDTYKKWVYQQVTPQVDQLAKKEFIRTLYNVLEHPLPRETVYDPNMNNRHRDEEGLPENATVRDLFVHLLAGMGINVNGPKLTVRTLTPEQMTAIIEAASAVYYRTSGPVDRMFYQVAQVKDTLKRKLTKQYIISDLADWQQYNDVARQPIENFARFCQDVYGSTELKTLLKTKWAFKGRVNNSTPVLKEKLWYYLTPGAVAPQSLQPRSSSSRYPDYMKGANFLKSKLAPVFGENMTVFRGYHQETKKLDRWYIEPDGSLRPNEGDYAAEIVSPPLPAATAMDALKTFYQQAQSLNLYTNNSTGLHINVSIPDKLDVLKLALFIGDQHVLKTFGRENNTYARSVLKSLKGSVDNTNISQKPLPDMEKEMKAIAKQVSGDHFATVNFNGKYVSFRHAGGDYLNRMGDIINTVGRFIRAMIIAADPNAYRNEYLAKLTKLVAPKAAEPGAKLDQGELSEILKGGIPGYYMDIAIRPGGYTAQDLLRALVSTYRKYVVDLQPDPTARQRLLSAPGFGTPSREHIATADDSAFFRAFVAPTDVDTVRNLSSRREMNSTEGIYDASRNRIAVCVKSPVKIGRNNPLFVKAYSALRNKIVSGPKGVLPEEDVSEGWKEKVGAAALAGAAATGASANTPKVPLDQAIQQATAVYNINKAVKKHKNKSEDDAWTKIEKRKAADAKAKGMSEDAAGVGVVAKNKKMAKDPRYSMSITKDVKPSTPKNMLRAFRLSEDFAARINPEDFKIKNFNKLDHILVNLCEMVVEGQKLNADSFGMVAACVLDPNNEFAFGINYYDDSKDKRIHAERAAILNYEAEHGRVPAGSIIITTLSPCCHPMDDRYGDSCTEIINDTDCHKVYCGYKDPTQDEDMNKTFHVMQTRNPAIIKMCKKFAATFLGDVVKEEEESHSVTEEDMMTMIKEFMPLAMKELKLKKVPPIELQPHVESHDGQATFGRFVNEEEKIYLGIADRHPVDILRTLAHELVHFKQYEQGKMYPGAGETGSPIENQAHWVAGIIMRHFNKKYPDAIKSKPLELDENFADGRNPQDKGDSARHGIPKKASLASLDKIVKSNTASSRKKQLAHWQANMRRGRNK